MGRKWKINRGSESKYAARCVAYKQSDAFAVCTTNFGTSRLQLIKNIVAIANTSCHFYCAIARCYQTARKEKARLFVVSAQQTTPDCPGPPSVPSSLRAPSPPLRGSAQRCAGAGALFLKEKNRNKKRKEIKEY